MLKEIVAGSLLNRQKCLVVVIMLFLQSSLTARLFYFISIFRAPASLREDCLTLMTTRTGIRRLDGTNRLEFFRPELYSEIAYEVNSQSDWLLRYLVERGIN